MCHPAGDLKSLSYSSTLETGDNEKWEEESAPPPFFLPDGKWKMSPRQRRIRKEKGRMRHTHNDIRRREREREKTREKKAINIQYYSLSLCVCVSDGKKRRARERELKTHFLMGSAALSPLFYTAPMTGGNNVQR
jgi:hypothetical protein